VMLYHGRAALVGVCALNADAITATRDNCSDVEAEQ